MIIVLDTSAGVEIVLQRTHADVLGPHVTESGWVIAPAFYIPEVTSVLWKYHRFTEMPLDRCEQAIDQAVAIPVSP